MPGAAGALFPLPALPQTSCCPHPQWMGWVMPLPGNCTGWGVPPMAGPSKTSLQCLAGGANLPGDGLNSWDAAACWGRR